MSLSERIKEVRKKSGLNQIEFGKRIGIGSSGMSKLESGDNNPSSQTIKLICSEFHISREWLEFGTGEMHPEAPGWTELVSRVMLGENEFAKQTMAAFCALDDNQWQQLREILETLKKAGL